METEYGAIHSLSRSVCHRLLECLHKATSKLHECTLGCPTRCNQERRVSEVKFRNCGCQCSKKCLYKVGGLQIRPEKNRHDTIIRDNKIHKINCTSGALSNQAPKIGRISPNFF